jgi:hypothetical protein
MTMKPEEVARTWIWKGLKDLIFAFDVEDRAFWTHSKFHEIMGLEKFLKALLLFKAGASYQEMTEQNARYVLDKIAKKHNHDFGKMIDDVGCIVGDEKITRLKHQDFSGFTYQEMVSAMKAGYLEYRYPVPRPEYLSHRIENEKLWRNPLGSSGITGLVYPLCRICYIELQKDVDFSEILEIFEHQHAHIESFPRFNNLFWEPGMDFQFNTTIKSGERAASD